MSNYEFLTKVLGLDGKVCWIGEPVVYDNGNFAVEVHLNYRNLNTESLPIRAMAKLTRPSLSTAKLGWTKIGRAHV